MAALMIEPQPSMPVPARVKPAWGSLWRVVENQAHNALNDKVAQFILLAVSQVIAVSQYYPQIVSALLVVPQLFFAPMAGWLADRFSKRRIIIWCSIAQVALLLLIAGAFFVHLFWVATVLFFGLALQAAVFGPAKAGIVKELVGDRHLTMASGWMQMTMILAFAGGQLLGGKSFQFYHDDVFHDPWHAAAVPMLVLAGAALLPLLFAFQVKPTLAHSEEKFSARLFTEHFTHLDDLFRNRRLWLTALGVSFFWLAATMLTLILIELAVEIEPNRAAQAALSSELLLFVAIGVVIGSFLTSWLSENRIELGLVPLGGVGMAGCCALAFLVHPGGAWFCFFIVGVGACSALFMVPLNAYLQDQVEPQVRGRMLAAAGLLDSLAMVAGIMLQLVLMHAGMGVRGQFLVLGALCLATSAYVLRIIPQNFIRFCVLSFAKIVYRIRVVHHDRVPEHGGALLLCNHVSYIDALILSAACERAVRFTAFDEFFRNPLLSAVLRLFGVVPISGRRAKDAIVSLADTLKRGNLVCIFPEGQLTRTGMMNEVRKGFELIARRAGAPVIPVYMDDLWGSIFSFERGRFFRKHPHHFPYHVSVLFGKPIPSGEVSVERCRSAWQEVAAEGISQRGEVNRGLPLAAAHALCRHPWRIAVAEGDARQRHLRRGELFGRAMQLARRWRKIPAHRIGVMLPEGIAAVTANVALVFAGKTVVNIAPAAAADPEALRAVLSANGISSIVTSAAVRNAAREFPWPDHVLYVESELEEVDELYLLADTAVAWLAPRASLRWWLRPARDFGGAGIVFATPDGPRFSCLSGPELLAQTEMLRGTDLLRKEDRLLCAAPVASAAGTLIGLWSTLLRGLPYLTVPPISDAVELRAVLARHEPNCALGDAAFAANLEDVQTSGNGPVDGRRPLRLFILTEPRPAAEVGNGPLVCPCLAVDDAGAILAVSMPDPPAITTTAEPQAGNRAGSCGRLLPGVRLQTGDGGTVTCTLPFGREVFLPRGTRIDGEGFVFLPDSR
jgi:acyl-[acyl-carrier-protein]-phospholipid O-acyltransferase / long-chain-fatty-acid--[acyl-carrier-protein] ligase